MTHSCVRRAARRRSTPRCGACGRQGATCPVRAGGSVRVWGQQWGGTACTSSQLRVPCRVSGDPSRTGFLCHLPEPQAVLRADATGERPPGRLCVSPIPSGTGMGRNLRSGPYLQVAPVGFAAQILAQGSLVIRQGPHCPTCVSQILCQPLTHAASSPLLSAAPQTIPPGCCYHFL